MISTSDSHILWNVCREQLLQKDEEIKAAQQFNNGGKSRNWDLIKQKITTAKVTRRTFLMFIENTNKYHKITDALSVLKYEVNGKKVNVLRPLGEGGFSQVYEVYDKVEVKVYFPSHFTSIQLEGKKHFCLENSSPKDPEREK